MHPSLQTLAQASKDLFFISETDAPFTTFQLEGKKTIEVQLLELAGAEEGSQVEVFDLPYFFRNQVKVYPGASAQDQERASRFVSLQQRIEQTLADVKVYCIGNVQVSAFIIGKLDDGSWGGLRTHLVQT